MFHVWEEDGRYKHAQDERKIVHLKSSLNNRKIRGSMMDMELAAVMIRAALLMLANNVHVLSHTYSILH